MKLPKNYVPGAGVLKATAFGGIGQRLMEKQGWHKGQGLGKDKSGMKEAIEVKEKKDTLGVGANGSWDWGHKFWEDAYNSAAKGIDHKGAASDSDTSSSSSDDEGCAKDRRVRRKAPGPSIKQATATATTPTAAAVKSAKQAKNKSTKSSSDRSSDSGSDGSSGSDSDGEAARSKGHAGPQHRDGTVAGGASAAELAIAAELAKDPWGRWGGKAGKMARIRQHEEEAAARARERLGLSAAAAGTVGGSKPGAAPGAGAGPLAAAAEAPQKPRIVITLTIKEDPSLKRAVFVATPSTGWWGSTYFVSAGAMGGMEETGEHVAKERQTFNEDDQANLYMKAHEAQRVGRKGLGKSTTVNIAGGKWEGSKKTFEDNEEQGAEVKPVGQQGEGQEAAGEGDGAGPAGKSGKAGGKKKRKSEVMAATAEAETEEQAADKGKKKKKRRKETDDAAKDDVAAGQPGAVGSGAVQAVKWLKVARVLLKQAPKRRLRLEKLCRQMLERAAKDAAAEGEDGAGQGALRHSMSHEKLTSLLHKKAKKSKVVIEDGFVSLPA